MSDLADFVLDFCRAAGGVVEPPAYGVYDVLLPDSVAAQLGIEPLQRFAFGEAERDADVVHLVYGHPLVERMAELARLIPACARFYINDVRLDKTGLAALARAAFSFPNATLVEVPRTLETRAMFHYLRFNFKAALLSDEKHEHMASVLMNAQTGAAMPDFSTAESYRLAESPAFTDMAAAPAQWTTAPNPLAPEPLRALLARAARAAVDSLTTPIAALQARAARHLELDRARLESYYADLERDLERRLKRADPSARFASGQADETKRANLESKLAAARADHAAKLADAEAKYRLRVELDLVNLAVIAQPKLTLPVRIENRLAAVTRAVVWDPLRHLIEPLACEVCFRPFTKLFLCANNHLACADDLAPQCVDCKRVYCKSCAHELTSCVVCDQPVCQRSLTRCHDCGRGTCREHAGLCHADNGQPQKFTAAAEPPAPPRPSPVPVPPQPKRPASRDHDFAKEKSTARSIPKLKTAPLTQSRDPGYRLDVQIESDEPAVAAFVLAKGDRIIAQREWELSGEGIFVNCNCEKGWECPAAMTRLKPESAAQIESQLEAEIAKLRAEYHIPSHRSIVVSVQGNNLVRLPKLRLRGQWKDEALLNAARAAFAATVREETADELVNYPDWAQAFTDDEEARYLPDIERFTQIAYGWLWHEGALKANDLVALTASLAQPGEWYSPERAHSLFKTDPMFRILRGNVISIESVEHPLKVLKEKEARRLPPRSFTAKDLLAVTGGPPALTLREAEIERDLNRHTGQKLYLHSLQRLIRNAEDANELLTTIINQCAPRDMKEANYFASLITEVWNNTFRYELRGRTPKEMYGK